jgi:hypothetical protein
MTTTVSFELANLLKEKGFDEQSLSIYLDGKIEELKSTISNSQFTTSRTYSAPTIAEVTMWLYEKHGIWVGVQPISVVGKFQFRTYYNNKGVMNQHWNDSMGKEFTSPTEAYEAAIKYTLENLI